jgi:glutamate 5-kinase
MTEPALDGAPAVQAGLAPLGMAAVGSSGAALQNARRIVVKVGSSLVTNEGRGIDADAVGNWCRQLAALAGQGRELVMVSSGAIAEGMKRLGWRVRPTELHELQAAAAVGQMGLAQTYETQLSRHGMGSAQVLLTHADLADRERYLNARSTLLTLLRLKVIPVINENDTVVNDEIKVGDNDTLGALVANLVEADALVILTDQRGLYSADPRKVADARFISQALAGDPALERMAGGAGSAIGRGGMLTKILAAKRAAGSGASTVIAWGREPDVLLRLAAGEAIGTTLLAGTPKRAARKRWMVDHLQLRGAVTVDDGALLKVRDEGKSLLPIGVTAVEGHFHRGDVIAVRSVAGLEIARGLSNYASGEARLIARKSSAQIAGLLGFVNEPELIHRDNLVLT